jgi:hypothetical protein
MAADRNAVLRGTVERVLSELGPSIQKTIMWHMNNRGVFSDPNHLDFEAVYRNLEELLGPLSDEIIDMTWDHLQKEYGAKDDSKSKSLQSIKNWYSRGMQVD